MLCEKSTLSPRCFSLALEVGASLPKPGKSALGGEECIAEMEIMKESGKFEQNNTTFVTSIYFIVTNSHLNATVLHARLKIFLCACIRLRRLKPAVRTHPHTFYPHCRYHHDRHANLPHTTDAARC